ncbi:MAG: glycogen/starch/alpha-glucan phosphorylase [Proteobacteria bacterium]|nr:glycogen/starch/alpha-glucan phosphorylase [Pseudomonadota bacterium]
MPENDKNLSCEKKELFSKTDVESLKKAFKTHVTYSLAKDEYSATKLDAFMAIANVVRDHLIERWLKTQQAYYDEDAKRVYYLSLEFLMGRSLGNSLVNLDLLDECYQAIHELGYSMEELRELEWDAGLGNGGLGRLAACFLDSMATMGIPGYGYGIRYEYGIFFQKLIDGYQVETPDNWLRHGNPWEFARPERLFRVKFNGRVNQYRDENCRLRSEWIDTEDVMAMAYDMPIPGYGNKTVNNLRLWAAKSTRAFDLKFFNSGDYIGAVQHKNDSENISRVLYPSDQVKVGKELRLKQQYFFVAASLQDIIRRYKKTHTNFNSFPTKVAMQLNDTHPAIAIPELMRILMDEEKIGWDRAWDITIQSIAYTNHTVLPEALEKWPVELMEKLFPRHMQIIYEINHRFLEEVKVKYPGDTERLSRMSVIEENNGRMVRMANLAIIGSHTINGVAALHSNILKESVFKDFYELTPEKFQNKTNGITQRRWLKKANPGLSGLISDQIGDKWITDLKELKKIEPLADDESFRKEWQKIKKANKETLITYVTEKIGVDLDINSMFCAQVKRMHEYKRQLLNVLNVITMYNRIKDNPKAEFVPRTVLFGGKSAPAYFMAKLIIKLMNSVADMINFDPDCEGKLKVMFLSNYNVSLAEIIIPATDLSEQISTAGMEASGTGNMKFSLNGALTIGTLDGANVEIMEEVGEDNIFIFGLKAPEVEKLQATGYDPMEYYNGNEDLKRVIDMIADGFFSHSSPNLFKPIRDTLLYHGDKYFLLADYADYVNCQERVNAEYKNVDSWTRKSIINVANMGKFSSDRTIADYAKDIWRVKPVPIK